LTESTADPTTTPAAEVDVCATPAGDTVDAVSVTGAFGTTPVLDYPTDLVAPDETERAIVIDGGVDVAPGANVQIEYTIVNATTGEELETTGFGAGTPLPVRGAVEIMGNFAKVIGCVGPGSRVVGVLPAADSGADGDDVVIFVADVVADLSPVEWKTDVPVIGGTDDAPTVTLPAVAPKADLELVVLAEGDGDVVGVADSVTVNYLGTAWETGEVFDESYSAGPATFPVTGVVDGFAAALIGQKVGSRVLVTMPPALGYGEAGTSTNALAGKTLVFLIDIVSTTPAA
jgi:peptidylprolyl isomerase